ncbi:MAG TPA: hypothetical protein VK063_12670 [Beutenbergiaceae bacterium]|nr:hypothetical protein [Beutenbergiaceae bacterium]
MTVVPTPLTASPSLIALDLTNAGAPREWQRERDAETEKFIMGRLAGLASLADRGGVDLITLGETFRLGGHRRRDIWLDGALAASRLARHTTRAALTASIPLATVRPEHIAGAIASVHRATNHRAGWQLPTGATAHGTGAGNVDAVLKATAATSSARGNAAGATPRPAVVVPVRTAVDAELAAARADVARLSVATLEEARAARGAIRHAAAEWGRRPDDVKVLVDVHAVLSADRPSAQARWDLLSSLELPEGLPALRLIGTGEDLATLWTAWVEGGGADGFTVVPASVPTDVAAVASVVVPALTALGLRSPESAAATPARRVRKSERAHAPAK